MYPGRFNTLLGGARASLSAGNRVGAAAFYRQLLDMASPESTREELKEARTFLSK